MHTFFLVINFHTTADMTKYMAVGVRGGGGEGGNHISIRIHFKAIKVKFMVDDQT